jgi:hypothetical protein
MREGNKSFWGMMQGNMHNFCDSIEINVFNIFIPLMGKASVNIIL